MNKSCNLKGGQKVFLMHLNKVASCCRADPVDLDNQSIDFYLNLWKQERQQLEQGVELPGCRHCWKAEHSGQQSYRQQMAGNDLNFVEIIIDNLCNQMCSYCSPKFSSEWENNIQQYGNFTNVSRSARDNLSVTTIHTAQDVWIDELRGFLNRGPVAVKLLGGEPLMQRRNLQKLLELNADNITTLSINTNLNPPSNKFLKWVLDTFPKDKLSMDISLDTVPEYNAIPRAGFDLEKFEENLDLVNQYNIPILFLSVVSVLNVFSIARYQTWLDTHGYRSKFFRINNPDCLDPCYLPDQFKQMIQADSLPTAVRESLAHTSTQVDLKRFEQYNYLTQYFQRTNTQTTDPALAEYWAWLTEKFK
jgi:sulfatase maturation enzyme AslB (radical SAM superfamily)